MSPHVEISKAEQARTLKKLQDLRDKIKKAEAKEKKATESQNQKAANVGEQPIPGPDKQVAPELSTEAAASNDRLAETLAKTTDLSTAADYINDALKTGGPQAQLEVNDLVQSLEDLQPGQGQKLAESAGMASPQNAIYDLTVNNQAWGFQNDGFVGQVLAGNNVIEWNENPDDNIDLGGNNSAKTVTFDVDGPIRIDPTTVTAGWDHVSISVDWYGLDENGNVMPEYRLSDTDVRQYPLASLYGASGYYDFAPPYPNENPNGYRLIITKFGQQDNNGGSLGTQFNIISRKGDKPVKRNFK